MIRRAVGTLLCFLYGFAVPLIAVIGLTLWREDRQELRKIEAIARRVTDDIGVPANVELTIVAPVVAVATFIIIWFLAGKRTRRATSMIVGLNFFAAILVGLVVIGPK